MNNIKDRLQQQIRFIKEIDKIKHIFRKTRLFDNSRFENDAEHSWHLAVMAILLSEYSNEQVDLAKVIKMVLIHDIVEIDAGDTFLYDDIGNASKARKERESAERIFGLLPSDQKEELINIWQEFESRETPESKFAAAIDRLEPLLQNYFTEGYTWKKHGIHKEQVINKNKPVIINGSSTLWEFVENLIEESTSKGFLEIKKDQ
jgi:putative hydrolases of HD superfamily